MSYVTKLNLIQRLKEECEKEGDTPWAKELERWILGIVQPLSDGETVEFFKDEFYQDIDGNVYAFDNLCGWMLVGKIGEKDE